MNKERIKGIVIGFILCLTLSTTVMVVANTQSVTRQVTYGVRVNLNGQYLHFTDDMRPFVMEGRTFLSVRGISETLDLPVDFDANSNTVYLGNRFAGLRRPLTEAAPMFGSSNGEWWSTVQTVGSVTMGGNTHPNAVTYRGPSNGTRTSFSLHNLDGQFRLLTGHIGLVDGTRVFDATINFYGDGVLLASFAQGGQDLPTPISIFVEDVRQLRITVTNNNNNGGPTYAVSAFLE